MKLSIENLQFIDTYLENSDIEYADIRMEMVDHVASEIEAKMETGDTRLFYNIFKDYMIENKASLLLNNKQFLKDTDKAISRQILKLLVTSKIVVLFLFLVAFSYYILPSVDKAWLSRVLFSLPILTVLPLILVYGILQYVYKVSRFSGIERMAIFFMAFFQLFNLSSILLKNSIKESVNVVLLTVIFSLTITFAVAITTVGYTMILKYKNRFKSVV